MTSTLWDPDGAGPAGWKLAIGGSFTTVGGFASRGVAIRDLTTGAWSTSGWGPFETAFRLASGYGSELFAGGGFYEASGVRALDGTGWHSLLYGVNGLVTGMVVAANGDLIVSGAFDNASGVPVARIARWDGLGWHALGGGLGERAMALVNMPNGDLVVGGLFTSAGGVPAARIARWDGVAWHPLGTGLMPAPGGVAGVADLEVLPNGDLVAAGMFGIAGGAPAANLARWDGTTWHAFGTGFVNTWLTSAPRVNAMAVLANGDLVVGGTFEQADGIAARGIARWDGSAWHAFGTGIWGEVTTLTALPNGALFVGGNFTVADGVSAENAAMWSAAGFAPIDFAFDDPILALAATPSGGVIAGGSFRQTPGGLANRVAAWNGAWSSLGAGVDGPVHAVTIAANGDVLVGGGLMTVGGVSTRVARWNGASWSAVGPGNAWSYTTSGLAELPSGELVASRTGTWMTPPILPLSPDPVLLWNGSVWTPLGNGLSGSVAAMSAASVTDVIVAGLFYSFGGLARWDGATWSGFGTVVPQGSAALARLTNGDIVFGGSFATVGGVAAANVARWDGAAWHPLGAGVNGPVSGLAQLPNGDLLAFGSFTTAGGGSAPGVARWNGASWTGLGTSPGSVCRAGVVLPSGSVFVAGRTTVSGTTSPHFALLETTCPASAVSFGAGCVGSGGANMLNPLTLPWENGVFRSRATGMPALGVALSVLGFQPTSIPLPVILPQAGPGCSLLVSLDRIDLLSVNAGTAETAIHVVPVPSLVGQTVYHQIGALEFDAALSLLELTSTNGLALTIGGW